MSTVVYILSIDVDRSVDSSIQVRDNCLHSIDRCMQFCRHVFGFVKDGAGAGGTSIATKLKRKDPWKYPFENSRE